MDPEITALAATAGTTLVTLLASDAWQGAKERFLALWQRSRPDRAAAIASELDAAREDLVVASPGGEQETRIELAAEWQSRLRRLLAAHPEAVGQLRDLMAELSPESGATTVVNQRAVASGQAHVYQAGRDLHLGQS